jgi:hypothetical protein
MLLIGREREGHDLLEAHSSFPVDLDELRADVRRFAARSSRSTEREEGGMSGIAAIGLRRAPSLFSAGDHRAGQEVAEFWIVYIVNLFLGGRS